MFLNYAPLYKELAVRRCCFVSETTFLFNIILFLNPVFLINIGQRGVMLAVKEREQKFSIKAPHTSSVVLCYKKARQVYRPVLACSVILTTVRWWFNDVVWQRVFYYKPRALHAKLQGELKWIRKLHLKKFRIFPALAISKELHLLNAIIGKPTTLTNARPVNF